MDLKAYYHRIRDIAKSITDEFVVMVSEETNDGGKPGVFTEVARAQAAKLVVEGRARLASSEETAVFREQMNVRRKEAERLAAATRVQVTVVPEKVYRMLESATLSPKKPGA